MKIRLSDISQSGLHIEDAIPLEPLNERMREGRECGIIFLEAPRVSLDVTRTPSGAETKGTIKSRYKQPCGLCSEEVDKDIEVEANFILKPRPPHAAPDDPDYMDDVGVIFYKEDRVDLENILQESLILSLSLYWQPPKNEKGECERCGLNLTKGPKAKGESGNNLGRLLKDAGLKGPKS